MSSFQVRMQYEIYPDTTEQVSRQIFLVNEIEVRDRLSLSKINKFLYQYTSDSLPRQTHANMVSQITILLRYSIFYSWCILRCITRRAVV